jgi:hypothetical protein
MIDGIRQPFAAGMAPHHDASLAATPGHRRHPRQGAQGVVISSPQRLRSLGEQRGEVDPADSWAGAKDHHVALLAELPRLAPKLATELVQLAMRLVNLLINQPKAGDEGTDMGTGGFNRASCYRQRLLAQDAQRFAGINAADPTGFENPGDRLLSDPGRFGRGSGLDATDRETNQPPNRR